jgi:hypothetical protein
MLVPGDCQKELLDIQIYVRLRFGVVFCVAGKSLALEQALVEILMRLIVRDSSLLRFAIGRRLVLAFRHVGRDWTIGDVVECKPRCWTREFWWSETFEMPTNCVTPPSLDSRTIDKVAILHSLHSTRKAMTTQKRAIENG